MTTGSTTCWSEYCPEVTVTITITAAIAVKITITISISGSTSSCKKINMVSHFN
jgi:hypothetical protein